MEIRLALFGTPDYSLIVFEKLRLAGYRIVCIVTKPPRLIGKLKILTPAPVSMWATNNHIPQFTPPAKITQPWLFADEKEITQHVLNMHPDLLVTADYNQKIPMDLINQIKFGGLNVHPSLLPTYRGPAPVPWAIFNGENKTGVSIVTLTENFDSGQIIAQEEEPILPTDTTDTLLTRLFEKGATLLLSTLPMFLRSPNIYNSQLITHNSQPSYFPRLTRDSGFEPWENINAAMTNGIDSNRIERKWRAFHPWPGLWTKVKIKGEEKRLKIIKLHMQPKTQISQLILILDEIQLEGKRPITTNISGWMTLLT